MASIQCPTKFSQLSGLLRASCPDSHGECPTSPSAMLPIRIDDRQPSDVSPDFCSLSVVIQDTAASRLTLHLKNPPLDDGVTELICGKNGKIVGSRPDLHVEIPLLTKEVGFLRKLAKAFRRIVGKGRTYPNANWKWVCPRTANSLDRFADRLMEYRRLRRHTPWRLFAARSPVDAPVSSASGSPRDRSRVQMTTDLNQADDEDLFRLLGME